MKTEKEFVRAYGLALVQALQDFEALRNRPDVSTLGTRVKVTRARNNAERTYYLDGLVVYGKGPERRRLYRLSGGAGSAVTVLDEKGAPIADADRNGAGLSRDFRDWIADSVDTDSTLCRF